MTAYATPTVQELGDFQTRTGEWVGPYTGGGAPPPPPPPPPLLRCSRALATTIERTRAKGGEPCRR